MDAPGIAVVCHVFYENLASEFRRYVVNIPVPFDLFISTNDPVKNTVIEKAFADWDRGTVDVRVTPNRGRDIAPKLVGFRDVYDRYQLSCTCTPNTRNTRRCSPTGVASSLKTCWVQGNRLQHLDGVSPAPNPWHGGVPTFRAGAALDNWGTNFATARTLAENMGISLSPHKVLDFPSGSMFWARSAALRPLLDLNLSYDDFPEEAGQIDGTPAHANRRLYYYAAERAGFTWLKVAQARLFAHTPAIVPIDSAPALDGFISKHGLMLTQPDDLPEPRAVHLPGLLRPARKG